MTDVEKRGAHGDPKTNRLRRASLRVVAQIAPPRPLSDLLLRAGHPATTCRPDERE